MATYSCDDGHNLMGGINRECQADGSWTGSDPTCERKLNAREIPFTMRAGICCKASVMQNTLIMNICSCETVSSVTVPSVISISKFAMYRKFLTVCTFHKGVSIVITAYS